MAQRAKPLPQRLHQAFALALAAAAMSQILVTAAVMAQTAKAVANGEPYSALMLLGHVLLSNLLAATALMAWAGARKKNNTNVASP